MTRRAQRIVLLMWLGIVVAARAHPQIFDAPTLEEMGVRYVSPDGFVEVKPSVRIELDGFVPEDAPAWHLDDTSPFVAGRASLFVDIFVGRRFFG